MKQQINSQFHPVTHYNQMKIFFYNLVFFFAKNLTWKKGDEFE